MDRDAFHDFCDSLQVELAGEDFCLIGVGLRGVSLFDLLYLKVFTDELDDQLQSLGVLLSNELWKNLGQRSDLLRSLI